MKPADPAPSMPRIVAAPCQRRHRRERSPRRRFALAALMLVTAAGGAAATDAAAPGARALHPELARLVELVAWRAELMRGVAHYKLANKVPVTAPQRERLVLRKAEAQAARAGLEPASARGFFRAQIELAKGIQRHWQQRWQATAPPSGPPPDLATLLRPAILVAGERLLEQLRLVVPRLADARADGPLLAGLKARLTTLGAEQADIAAVATGLRRIRYAEARSPSVIDRVANARLRIGTTGDYRPFSWERDGKLTGIAVELGRRLAASLDAEPVFVRTSWPTLLEDLAAGRFDIAMSGISRRLFRQRAAYLSNPYHQGGKTPIARCEDAARLGSLGAIDSADVRVLVNPGGTNERFVRERLEHAQIRVIPDNRRIFEALLAGTGDVMITDAIEVRLQSRLHPELCATMAGRRLTFTEKGFLLPRGDEPWLHYVNTWLREQRLSGALERVFERHLAP